MLKINKPVGRNKHVGWKKFLKINKPVGWNKHVGVKNFSKLMNL